MMVFDSHLHLFNAKIIDNVSHRQDLVGLLNLQAAGAHARLDIATLAASMKSSGVAAGLILPTAAAADVERINTIFIEKAGKTDFLHTAGTLHPAHPHNQKEIDRLCQEGIRGIKLCSFSQGFVLDGPPALALFDLIDLHNRSGAKSLFVVLDTFYHAHSYFGTDQTCTTRPSQIAELARRYPHTVFIGAHMGGLSAPFEQLWTELPPSDNLLLDTSNAAHTLTQEQFVALLKRFGPGHIVFGTDWPWFEHEAEIARINELTSAAGFSARQKAAVFYDNMAELLSI
ncbi:MAG: amidohydrolase family protein [Syntrophobacterales bacterium]|nr:amidohydrolase family protein [Syntrophobacterales bacterium]